MRSMAGFFDADWYRARNPDISASGLDPLQHFIRHGAEERRDPNRFFDSAWYDEHYPDVAASGLHPLLHYLAAGAAELRNPHPRFDAVHYVDQHPEAAPNPLLYHLREGEARGYVTERIVEIGGYLPSEEPALPLPHRVFADIVIPVYRGLEETRRCLNSVLADNNRPLGRIIVVDDCSPEPGLTEWLRDLAADGHIYLLRNQRNVGFVASVNHGMAAAAEHDVVLLNSDTEVPDGWLNRLMAQAYADARIASVSPLSNNATICSYPDNAGGPIAFGQTLARIDAACQTANAGRWVDVPTTVGFAMYIRREALADVGDFDAERFTVGYGEENDFCLRASARGWRHRLACDTFVYHKGSVSFGDRMRTLSARAMQLILERFPGYTRSIAQHVALGAADPFRFALTAALFRTSGLPVILMVTHGMGGGIRRHIDGLVARYHDAARVLLLEATDRGAALSVPALPHHPVLSLPADRIDDLILLLRSTNLSRVHIHHLLGLDIDMRQLIHRIGVPFDVTVHDYYAICPQINLLPWRHSLYCNEPDVAACNDCIAHRASHGAREILVWRAERAWPFHEADRVLCPSADVLSRLQRYGLADRAVLAPHEPVAAGPWNLCVPSLAHTRLRIAVLGTLVDHKGARTVAAVAEAVDPKTTEIHLIGHTDGPFPDAARKRMKITGRYDDADLPALIRSIAPHIIWFPMTWPETFSYTLSAAVDAGAVIAATRIGAFSERLEGRPLTWLADVATAPRSWVALFEDIRAALRKQGPIDDTPPRPPVADFYAERYLLPAEVPTIYPPRPPRGQFRGQPRGQPREHPRRRVAIVPERFESGYPTPRAYVRLLQPLLYPAIARDADVRVTDAKGVFTEAADVIVTQRCAISDIEAVNAVSAHARRTGAALVFDLDDDLLDAPRTHLDARARRIRAHAVRRMLDVADVVWLSTAGLAARLSSIRPDAVLLENRLDERIWTQPPYGPVHAEPVRILCMGNSTHDQEFAMIQPTLLRLKNEYGGRLVIDILGMTSRHELPAGLNRIRPSIHASQSYPGFVNWLTAAQPAWHIGLAPLLDTPFNQGKSCIKALDYAAMGLLVLASDTPVYRGSVADGPAGQLVSNSPEAWYAALDWLMRNQDMRRAMMARARDAFLAHGTLAGQAAARRDAWMQARSARRADTAA